MAHVRVVGSLNSIKVHLLDQLVQLADALGGERRCVVPFALLLIVPEEHGGDSTAVELIRRLRLLDDESHNIIDFYCLGWRAGMGPGPINLAVDKRDFFPVFDYSTFKNVRKQLKEHGVKVFGGNADLILVDASLNGGAVTLHFDRAIHIDLAKKISLGEIPTLGSFLQEVIAVAEKVRESETDPRSPVYCISDQLGLAYARESIFDFILSTWGSLIGAKRLKDLAVRKIGPALTL